MVYLLQKYFGRDGREEADELSAAVPQHRRAAHAGAFNEQRRPALLVHGTYFTDRDGTMQLHSLAQSGFDPLSRTCRFTSTEKRTRCSSAKTGSAASCSAVAQAMRGKPASTIRPRSPRSARSA